MMRHLNSRQKRILAVGLAVVACLLVLAALIGPVWWLHNRYDRALDDFGSQLSRHLRIVAAKDATEARLTALKSGQQGRNFLKSANPTNAATEIQDVVRSAIESNGARFVAVQIPPHKDDGRYRQVTINVQMSANGPALRKVLHAIESGQPRLMVENFSVRQTVGAGYKPVPGVEPDMFVQLDVVGFALVPAL